MMTDLASTTPQSLGRDPMVGLRLARVDGFEPAIALGQDELPAYLRRFKYLKRKDVCNGLSVCYFMKRLCCYELLRNLYNIARICRKYWMYNNENTEFSVKKYK